MKAMNCQIIGNYGQTELGHGTYLRYGVGHAVLAPMHSVLFQRVL